MKQLFPGPKFFTNIRNSLPSPLFVVDANVQILYLNIATSGLLGKTGGKAYLKCGGEALHCLHAADNPEGFGHAAACSDCVIRNSVRETSRGKRLSGK